MLQQRLDAKCHRCSAQKIRECVSAAERVSHHSVLQCMTLANLLNASPFKKLCEQLKKFWTWLFLRLAVFTFASFGARRKRVFFVLEAFQATPGSSNASTLQRSFSFLAAAISILHVIVGSHVGQLSTLPIGGLVSMIASALSCA